MGDLTTTADYVLPWNAPEGERLDFQHRLLCKLFGGLYRAPLDKSKIRKVLDIGCGTGVWTMDFAREFPDAEVVGLDVNAWPDWKDSPPNCSFRHGNAADPALWSSLAGDFDLIHVRFLMAGIVDWPGLLQQCAANLAPGGWIECQEICLPFTSETNSTPANSDFMKWAEIAVDGFRRVGLAPDGVNGFPQIFTASGLVNIRSEPYKMFLGPWPTDEHERELGKMGAANFHMGLRGYSEKVLVRSLGWSPEEFEQLCRNALADMESAEHEASMPIKICIAQKPELKSG